MWYELKRKHHVHRIHQEWLIEARLGDSIVCTIQRKKSCLGKITFSLASALFLLCISVMWGWGHCMNRSAKVFWQKLLCENPEKQTTSIAVWGQPHSCPTFKHFTFHSFKETSAQRLPELCLTQRRSLHRTHWFLPWDRERALGWEEGSDRVDW